MMPLDEVTEETEQAEAESAEIGRMCQRLSSGLAILSSQDKQQSFVNGDHKVPIRQFYFVIWLNRRWILQVARISFSVHCLKKEDKKCHPGLESNQAPLAH